MDSDTDDNETEKWHEAVPFEDFVETVSCEELQVLKKYGLCGYRNAWCNSADFPITDLLRIICRNKQVAGKHSDILEELDSIRGALCPCQLKHMTKVFSILFFGIICFLAQGCAAMYGYKHLDSFDEAGHDKFKAYAEKKSACVSIIGTTLQRKNIVFTHSDPIMKKNLSQPIQILYFHNDSMISYHVNCQAKGSLFGINWNTGDRFGSFPPKTAVSGPSKYLSMKDLQKTYPQISPSDNKPYTIVLFWTNMFYRISKSAFNSIIENMENFDKKDSCSVYLINDDSFFSEVLN